MLLFVVGFVGWFAEVAQVHMSTPDVRSRVPTGTGPSKTIDAALDRLRRNMSRHVKLSDNEFEYFSSMLVSRHLKKKESLLTAGEVCGFEGFVHAGCLRVYCTDNDGADHILYFAPEDSWFTDVQSFISKTPALLNIDAVESSDVFLLAGSNKERLYREVPKFERLFRLMAQWALVALQDRLMGCMRLTAVERYRDFAARYPALATRVPQYQIASYLGISPEFLSKIRRPPPRGRFRKR